MSEHEAIFLQSLGNLLKPIEKLLQSDEVSEIMINRFDTVYEERRGIISLAQGVTFEKEQHLRAAAVNIAQYVGKIFDSNNPSIVARLPPGIVFKKQAEKVGNSSSVLVAAPRVQIVQPPAATDGICISIRKFPKNPITLDELLRKGVFSNDAFEYLREKVGGRESNIIVSGGTGSGKTTLLNCLSEFIDPNERILVMEDATELRIAGNHVLQFETQPGNLRGQGAVDMRELVRSSLRLRPDRIIVGECRGAEALDMVQAMTTGHEGSMSTCHSNSPLHAFRRLEVMMLMNDIDMPLIALRAQLAQAVNLIIQTQRFADGSRKVTEIAEVGEQASDDLKLPPITPVFKLQNNELVRVPTEKP